MIRATAPHVFTASEIMNAVNKIGNVSAMGSADLSKNLQK